MSTPQLPMDTPGLGAVPLSQACSLAGKLQETAPAGPRRQAGTGCEDSAICVALWARTVAS